LNPYQPPKCNEPAAEVSGAAVMQVRYSLAYSVLFVVSGLLAVSLGIAMYPLSPVVTGMLEVAGVSHLAIAALFRRRVYFEVFENRIEFLSPAFPRWRRAKPLEFIGARSLHRWVSRREDFSRFVQWRDGSLR
jgi:hypothetical protein